MNELLEIDKLYSTIFDDVQSFYKYYKSVLTEKTSFQWGNEFKSQLKIINEYLKPALVGIISADQVNLWFSRIRHWNVNIKTIKYRIDEDILLYKAHFDILPEGYYSSELIANEVAESGKPYDYIADVLKKGIAVHISNSAEIQDYINESNIVADFVFTKMKERYKSILTPDLLQIPAIDFSTKFANRKTIVTKTKAAGDKLPAFDTTPNKKNVISAIYKKLISGTPPYISGTENEFIQLFSGPGHPDIVLNWLRGKNELHVFIDKLYENGIIDPNDTKRWEKTATYFTVKGNPISANDIKGANHISNKAKLKQLTSFFA